MAIRPKKGDRVVFKSWVIIDDQPSPPKPWTGTVVYCQQANRIRPALYNVQRDADGEVVTMLNRDLSGYAQP